MTLAKFHHDIEEIHRIELKLVAEANLRLDGRKIFVGRDIGNDVDDQLLAIIFRHG
jgi:hypothetical protein